MSLYDMYFSKKNKNYFFEIISKIVKDECDIDIINDKKYINIYTLHYSTIFDKNNTEVLSELNSDVINTIGEIIINDIRNNKNDNIINKTEKKINHNSLQNFEKSKKKIILYSTNRNINSLNRYKFNINYEYNNLFPKYITLLKEENNCCDQFAHTLQDCCFAHAVVTTGAWRLGLRCVVQTARTATRYNG